MAYALPPMDMAYALPPVDPRAFGALGKIVDFAKNLSSGTFDSGGSCLTSFSEAMPPRHPPPVARRPLRSGSAPCKKKATASVKLPSIPWQPTLPPIDPIKPLPDPRGVSIPVPRQFQDSLNYAPLSARELAMVRWDIERESAPVVPKTARPIVLPEWTSKREPGPPKAEALAPRPRQQSGCLDEAIHRRIEEMLMEPGKPSLQWVTTDCDADYRNLHPGQFYNHFQNNHELTTKVGLHRSLEELAMTEGENVDSFFPRCYDVTQRCEREDFILDFRRSAALAVIEQHLKLHDAKASGISAQGYCCCLDVLRVAMHTMRRWCWDLDPEHLDEDDAGQVTPNVSDEWWDALVVYSELTSAQLCGENEEEATSKRRARRHHRAGGGDLNEDELAGRAGQFSLERLQNFREWPEFKDIRWGEAPAEWQDTMRKLVEQYKALCPQASIHAGRNVWIVKPGTNSKGSGVICMSTLPELLHHCDAMTNRIVQKYIERPLLLFGGRKFDIRQWVLVTSVAPLKVFLFSECYLRLCNDVYDLGDLENRQSHISNWQVNKHGQNAIDGSVASLHMFEEELQKITGNSKFFEEHLAPQMERIVMSTMRSAQTRLVPRKECFELYGFDVMVDEDFKMWLLEVNLSPGCENRVAFIDQMIKRMSSRLIEVAVLGNEEPDGKPLDWIPIENDKSCSDARDPRDEAALRSGQALPCVADLSITGHQISAPKRRKRRATTPVGYTRIPAEKMEDSPPRIKPGAEIDRPDGSRGTDASLSTEQQSGSEKSIGRGSEALRATDLMQWPSSPCGDSVHDSGDNIIAVPD